MVSKAVAVSLPIFATLLLGACGNWDPPNHPVATPCTPESEHYCADTSGGCCSDSYPTCAFVAGEPTCNSVDPTPPDDSVKKPRSVPRVYR